MISTTRCITCDISAVGPTILLRLQLQHEQQKYPKCKNRYVGGRTRRLPGGSPAVGNKYQQKKAANCMYDTIIRSSSTGRKRLLSPLPPPSPREPYYHKVECAHVMHGRTRITIDPRYPYNAGDGARRVFTDQADIACTKRKAP